MLAFLAGPTVVALPSSASATITFGANLNRPPDNATYTCNNIFPSYATYPSCTLESLDLATGESGFPPEGNGVVSIVRVRAAVNTPVQVVVERALRPVNPAPGYGNTYCCSAVALSPEFTAVGGQITAEHVNLPVTQDAAPEASGYYVDDHLALSVLAPNVPIPANLDSNATFDYWAPAWSYVGQEEAGPGGASSGAVILFDADWNPMGTAPGTGAPPNLGTVGGGAPGGGDTPGGGAAPPFTLASPNALVRGGRPQIRFKCVQVATCSGLLRLQSAAPAGATTASLLSSPSGRAVTYASTSFRVPAGATRSLRPSLASAGRRLLRSHRSAKVFANFTIGGKTYDREITLRR